MSNRFQIRAGDQSPTLKSRLLDGNGDDIDVGESVIKFILLKGNTPVEKTASYNSSTKVASVTFSSGDFPSTGGQYTGYFKIDDLNLTVPNNDRTLVEIVVAKDWTA